MIEHVAEIVAAYVGKNQVGVSELPELIASVSQALSGLGQAPAPPAASPLIPAVSIRRSVRAASITCLDCGWSGQTLKRHVSAAHGLTVDQYRARWGLSTDYPMVAPDYSARRSELAKALGLGAAKGGRPRRAT